MFRAKIIFFITFLVQLFSFTPFSNAQTNAAKSPFARIVMIGASVSAGFTESELFGGPKTVQFRLHHYLNAALLVPHEPVTNLANAMFFLAPEAEAQRQLERAAKTKPTLVVAVDFLFWFCYGDVDTEQQRLEQFEKGLKFLESVHCPLVVGDIPDAAAAVKTGMLRAEQVPTDKTISAANQRLKAWANGRPQVAILSISSFLRNALANQPLTIHKLTVPQGKTRALLQSDLLHTTARGCAALALAILDATPSTSPKNDVRWNFDEVFSRGYYSSQPHTNNPAKPPGPATLKK